MIRVERPQPSSTFHCLLVPMVGLHVSSASSLGHSYVLIWTDDQAVAVVETLVRWMADPRIRLPVFLAVAIVCKHPTLKRPFFRRLCASAQQQRNGE